MKRGNVLLWGFAGTTVLTTILRLGQAAGLTRIDLPLILGLIFTQDRDRAKAYGFLTHFVNGWIFAGIYAATFRSLRRTSWWIGGTVGLIHGLFVLTAAARAGDAQPPLLHGAHVLLDHVDQRHVVACLGQKRARRAPDRPGADDGDLHPCSLRLRTHTHSHSHVPWRVSYDSLIPFSRSV